MSAAITFMALRQAQSPEKQEAPEVTPGLLGE